MQIKINLEYLYHIAEQLNTKHTEYYRKCEAIKARMLCDGHLSENTHFGKSAVSTSAKCMHTLESSKSTPARHPKEIWSPRDMY